MQSVQRLNDTRTGMAIVDHGNPGAWDGTRRLRLSYIRMTTKVFDGMVGALDLYSDGSLDVRCATSQT